MGVCVEPSVHGLADTADLLQGWGVEVRPAKFQYLRPKPGVISGRSPDGQPGQWGQHTLHMLVPGSGHQQLGLGSCPAYQPSWEVGVWRDRAMARTRDPVPES